MRKLVFLVALFCCSTQAMAVDCSSLAGKSLQVSFNGHTGLLGPTGITLVNQSFQTTVKLGNEAPTPVKGTCTGRHIQFTRGVAPNTQSYDGWMFTASNSQQMAGLFANSSNVKFGWYATIVPKPPAPPSPSTVCKDLCHKERQDCHQDADSSQQHAACTALYNTCVNKCP
ncbi:MAG TPA: hypothetical protein VN493_24940 [Thermoanaerobaculia bacterium]|nr:hypothetical protein [Thermoanaerobaculia bacterium]